MKKLSCNISVGAWTFDFVSDIEIVSTWDTLTDTCKIELPRNIIFKRDGEVIKNLIGGENSVFSRGDQVIVQLGYDGFLKTRFVGRLVDVIPNKPMVLMCEDEMYRMKQAFIKEEVVFEKTTLKEVIRGLIDNSEGGSLDFLPEEDLLIGDVSIEGKISFSQVTVAKSLEFLRKKLGIVSYWRHRLTDSGDAAPYFVSGLAYSTEGDKYQVGKDVDSKGITSLTNDAPSINEQFTVKFKFGQNIINDSDLVYKRLNDENIKVIGISKQKDNSVITSAAGNEGGDTVKINYPGLTQSELDIFVQERLRRSKYEGFQGGFEAFLDPIIEHGETVQMINSVFPEKEGFYLVKEVVTRFGVNGGRQFITLDARVDAPIIQETPKFA